MKNLKITEVNRISQIKNLKKYVSFLNDQQVMKFSQNLRKKHTISTQKKFLKNNLKKNLIFQINFKKEFIGMIFLKNIDKYNMNCTISYMIGDKNYWKKGIGTFAVKFIKEKCFEKLKIKKIYTHVYKKNISSIKILQKNNFKIVGEIKKFYKVNYNKNGWDNLLILST